MLHMHATRTNQPCTLCQADPEKVGLIWHVLIPPQMLTHDNNSAHRLAHRTSTRIDRRVHSASQNSQQYQISRPDLHPKQLEEGSMQSKPFVPQS